MSAQTKLNWKKIHQFLLEVGVERDPENFCLKTLHKINTLIPYDSAVLFLLDQTGTVYKNALVEVESRWYQAYLEYYSELERGAYSFHNVESELVVSWDDLPETEYVADFVRPQHYNYTATLHFCDLDSRLTCAMALNRFSRKTGFTDAEVKALHTVMPHLTNLHANLYVSKENSPIPNRHSELFVKEFPYLTRREAEITNLLCQRYSTKMIESKLMISHLTVYKHVEHIFQKLKVSSRDELLEKIIDCLKN